MRSILFGGNEKKKKKKKNERDTEIMREVKRNSSSLESVQRGKSLSWHATRTVGINGNQEKRRRRVA